MAETQTVCTESGVLNITRCAGPGGAFRVQLDTIPGHVYLDEEHTREVIERLSALLVRPTRRDHEGLDQVRRKVCDAKQAVFAAQDAAAEVADLVLLGELRQARHRLEAADRRQASIRIESGEP